MGAWNHLWHFIFSLLLCTKTGMTEGRNLTTATAQSHVNGSVSTEPGGTTGLAAHSSNAIMAEPNATTARSLLDTSFLSPSTMRMVGGEGGTDTEPTVPNGEGSSPGISARSDVVSPATPTTGPGTTATGMGTGSGTASSLPFRPISAVTSHSMSSPDGSTAATPRPQRSSTSSTTEEHLATTAQPSTALVFSTLSSTSAITSAQSAAVTAEHVTHSPTTPRRVASTSGTSPATDITEASLSPTPGSSTETSAARHTSTPLTQGQATLRAGTTPSSMGSPLPYTTTASVATSATTPPGEGASPTMNQGRETTTKLNYETTHSLPATSLVSPSTMRTVGGEGRTETTPTTPVWEGSSLGVSAGSAAMSPAIPTTGPDITAASMGAGSGTASSLPLGSSSAVTSHSSSSPVGSTGVTPSLQQNSSSSTTEEHLATTSHPPTAPLLSPLSSTAGVTGVQSDAVTAEVVTHSPALSTPGTNPVASASSPSPASDTTEASLSSTPGGSMETSAAPHTSTPLTQGQATVEAGTTSSSSRSPLSPKATASIGNNATTPPGEGESPTMNQGTGTTNDPSAETSHSLPDTSLVTTPTTNLKMSTSVSPSVTGTCSPITLSIQLENVTSTTIQFSWKPQGGTGDSPYTVLLQGKSGEMEKRILNGTSTAFENLLSGHQYQISVDVSTCSKNVSTSLTVQTAAEVYNGTTRITNEEFKREHQNKSSREFQEFETKFITEITKHLPQEIQELKNKTKMRVVINSIQNGSVIVVFDIVLDVGQNITKPEISDAFIEALNMSTEFEVDFQKTVIEARNSCQPDLNDCSQNAACTAEGATYSCQCKEGFTDNSPQVPGRVCWQDLPSKQTTPVPPETETTGVTGQITPVPPENYTTGFTEETTPVPSQNVTTGFTEETTPLPPENDTTRFTEETTPLPPENDTTGFTEEATPVPPENDTTGFTEETTTVPPENDTTGFTEETTTVPPENDTTRFTEQTTTVPPENVTTGFTEQTTTVPPENDTTGFTELTTTIPPENETTGVTAQTTPIPSQNVTTGFTEQTTPFPPETDTTGLTDLTTTIPPENETTGFTEETTTVPPENDTTRFTEQTTTVPPENVTTGFTELTTTIPPENETTGVTAQTTPIPSQNVTTGFTEETTPVPPENETIGITALTTPVPSQNVTTGFTDRTTPFPPETDTTGLTELTTTIPPENETTEFTEQTTPVPPENGTGFTGSTPNPIFTTTFPSPPCMPVSIEIQNVTGEEIQLSWSGGSTGSLYNISLMDGKQEINETTTKEAKAVFKHLLPAHVYTISVGVSSCAENNRTSVTVRTDPVSCFSRTEFCLPENTGCSDLKGIVCSDNQAFACRVLLKSQTFNNTLYNSESQEYKEMAESIKTYVVGEMRLELKDERFDITVLGFRPGSVIADFISLLPKEEPVDVNLIQTQLSEILKHKFGDETELTVQALSVQSPTDNSSAWKAAVIVLGVLLGVALVLILLAILFYIYMRKRWGKYFVEPRDSWEFLSKSAYKMNHVSFTSLE